MMHIVCPHCAATNRLPEDKLHAKSAAICGKCKRPLFTGHPIDADAHQFTKQIHHSDLPVVVDFWAPWCGPCRAFAPTFAQIAQQLDGRARFVKVNTEVEQALAAQYGIRSIPTLMVFKHGRKLGELAGALPGAQFLQWVSQYL